MRDALVHSKQGEVAVDSGGARGAVTMLNHIIEAMLGGAACCTQASHAEAANIQGGASHMGRTATSLLWPIVMRMYPAAFEAPAPKARSETQPGMDSFAVVSSDNELE